MIIEAIWEQQVGHGMEHLVLTVDERIRADGIAVGELEGKPYRVHYSVDCDAHWSTQQFRVRGLLNDQALELRRRGGDWIDAQGRVQAELSGCSDVDIMVTPFTNTLPIRRLALEPGQAARISVIYVSVPELQVSRADQIYTCLQAGSAGSLIRYESVSTGFTAELGIDADGLVTDYPGIFRLLWKRSSA